MSALFARTEGGWSATPEASAHRLARRTDPETSHQAAESIIGHLSEMQVLALGYVQAHPNHTAQEIASHFGIGDPRVLNRRLPELERLGAVARGPARRCVVTGRSAAVWIPQSESARDHEAGHFQGEV